MSHPQTRHSAEDKIIKLRLKDRVLKLSVAEAFYYGHCLLRKERIESAASLFEYLSELRPNNRQVTIMLARCKARLGDYQSSIRILNMALEGDDAPAAERLHTAFVFQSLGMLSEARTELLSVVEGYRDASARGPLDVIAVGVSNQQTKYERTQEYRNGPIAGKLASHVVAA